jgi:hypothetical protein
MIALLVWLIGSLAGLWVGYRRGYIQIGGAMFYDAMVLVWIFGGAAIVKKRIQTIKAGAGGTWREVAKLRHEQAEAARAKASGEQAK